MSIGRVITLISMLAAVCALGIGSVAFAQSASPAQAVYNPGGEVKNVVSGGGPADIVPATSGGGNVTRETGTTPSATGSLPFTGFEAGLVALAGLVLLGSGVAMRRISRSNS